MPLKRRVGSKTWLDEWAIGETREFRYWPKEAETLPGWSDAVPPEGMGHHGRYSKIITRSPSPDTAITRTSGKSRSSTKTEK